MIRHPPIAGLTPVAGLVFVCRVVAADIYGRNLLKLSELSDKKWLLPWLVPAGIVFTVLVVAFAPSAIVGVLFILVGWVGIPGFYLAYRRTRREQRPER